MKPLPYISISGIGKTPEERLQSLIEFEPVLYLLGYNNSEDRWNDYAVKSKKVVKGVLSCHENGGIVHVRASLDPDKEFCVKDQQAIIDYILNYEAE